MQELYLPVTIPSRFVILRHAVDRNCQLPCIRPETNTGQHQIQLSGERREEHGWRGLWKLVSTREGIDAK
jgi:hypothetical protein